MRTTFLKQPDFISRVCKATIATAIGCLLLTACGSKTETGSDKDSLVTETDTASAPKTLKPTAAAPAWAPDIKPEMQAVIEKLVNYKDKPIPQLTAAEARKNHTPTDAVMELISENNIPMPEAMVDTMGKMVPVKGDSIPVRIYTPKSGNAPFPVIVYYHGGGFVIADLDVYDASAKSLAEQTGAVVVSAAYRLAPEHKFPTAHDDAYAAYLWTVKNVVSLKGDPKKIAVAGESAGGNLAANVSIMARDKGAALPIHQLLVYPVAGSDMTTESYQKYASAKPLDKPMMEWFVKNYLHNMGEGKDPRINLVAANLKGLPPTTIVMAEIDPLQRDGEMLGEKLKSAGVKVSSKTYPGVTHEFFGMGLVVPEAKDAMAYAADELKMAFKK
ncbi:alpha/beta hydrolase [Dyadobacter arcticus]|uniref:Acetyl esterase/lipase n=1 Tax=Dyadobacter arcticus TaxID=1078754 RepID=A0ABX0UQN2_9BACT|nr:alpha/beta hydrolase [Dyadobacter arcticus]NIJ53885.1 acetyl esterase/lipase [Dyadobacter arcticus]